MPEESGTACGPRSFSKNGGTNSARDGRGTHKPVNVPVIL